MKPIAQTQKNAKTMFQRFFAEMREKIDDVLSKKTKQTELNSSKTEVTRKQMVEEPLEGGVLKNRGPKKIASAENKFKKKHLAGHPKAPDTLMPNGKPMGTEVEKVPIHLKGLDDLPSNHDKYVKDGWPSLDVEYSPGRHTRDFRNFTDAKPETLKPGTKIYRIIDDQSTEFKNGVSGTYWATEMPKNKTAWRKDYAVKDSWNDNGYAIEETIGPEGLKVGGEELLPSDMRIAISFSRAVRNKSSLNVVE